MSDATAVGVIEDARSRPGRGGAFRRAIKQAAFFLFLNCGYIVIRDALLSLSGRSRVVILYYHRVGWADVLSKPTAQFRSELEYLKRNYECLTLRQLRDRLAEGLPIRRKVAVVTFDDGYRDNYTAAFPELQRAGVPATFFVATGFVGTKRRFAHDSRALERGQTARDDWEKITWDDLRQMQSAGMEIGSHTVEHANLGAADPAATAREVGESLQTLQAELGDQRRAFSFPWGKRPDMSETALQLIRSAGYYAAVTTVAGATHWGDDLYGLRRIDTGNGQISRLGVLAMIEGFGSVWLARRLQR